MNTENQKSSTETPSSQAGVVESHKFECGQCGRFFQTQDEVYSHSHVMDIADQMRENGENEDDIDDFISGSRRMGW
jgi:hypothetical protein